jgi:hypothetical protein
MALVSKVAMALKSETLQHRVPNLRLAWSKSMVVGYACWVSET